MSGDYPPLPGVLADIEEIVGRDAAIAVALEFGGEWVHVPSAAHILKHPDHRLAQALPSEAAAAVAGRLCGGTVYFPMAARACAAHLFRNGWRAPDIARRLRISRATVRRYIHSG